MIEVGHGIFSARRSLRAVSPLQESCLPVVRERTFRKNWLIPANPLGATPSEGNDTVRRSSITSGLLILVFATSAFGCVTGSGSEPLASCRRPQNQRPCIAHKSGVAVAKSASCSQILKSSRGQCSLRSLTRFQFAEFRNFDLSSPLMRPSGKASLSFNSGIIVLSIGSPETDRGPPHS